jgi:arylsulfatase A-like enzyme
VLKSSGQAKLDRALFWHFPGYLGAGMTSWRTTPAGAIRRGDWKLLEFFEDGRLELYNLAQDLGQKRDLASSEPARLKAMHDELVAWRKKLSAPMPTPNKPGVAASER